MDEAIGLAAGYNFFVFEAILVSFRIICFLQNTASCYLGSVRDHCLQRSDSLLERCRTSRRYHCDCDRTICVSVLTEC
jgi:hypothetical protein